MKTMKRGAQRRYRRQVAMTVLCALLFVYIVGLLALALAWGTSYSFLQWLLIGVMVAASAAMLGWQIRTVRRARRAAAPDAASETAVRRRD